MHTKISHSFIHRLYAVALLSVSLAACQTTPSTLKPEAAAEELSQVQSNTPDIATGQPESAFELALKASRAGKTEQAIAQFIKLQQQDPTPAKVHTNLGLLYLHQNDPVAATESFLRAIAQDNNDAIAYNHLAIIQRQQGDFKQALFNYYKAINADPEYANAHLNLGILLDLYLQELPKALEQYLRYQQLTNNSNEDVEKWIIDIQRRIESTSDSNVK